MGKLVNIVTSLHESSKREYLPRMIDDKANCMVVAKQYEKDYWDGDRRFGYGGYIYIPGRWKPVAELLIKNYKLTNQSSVLDVGCGMGGLSKILFDNNLKVQALTPDNNQKEYIKSKYPNLILTKEVKNSKSWKLLIIISGKGTRSPLKEIGP